MFDFAMQVRRDNKEHRNLSNRISAGHGNWDHCICT